MLYHCPRHLQGVQNTCLAPAPLQVYKHAKRLGYGEHDVSAVYIRYSFENLLFLFFNSSNVIRRARFWSLARAPVTCVSIFSVRETHAWEDLKTWVESVDDKL